MDGRWCKITSRCTSDYFYPISYITFKENRKYSACIIMPARGIAKQNAAFVGRFFTKSLGRHIYGIFEKLVANDFYYKIRKQLKNSMQNNNIIEVRGLVKNYRKVAAVRGIDFSVKRGDFFAFHFNGAGTDDD